MKTEDFFDAQEDERFWKNMEKGFHKGAVIFIILFSMLIIAINFIKW